MNGVRRCDRTNKMRFVKEGPGSRNDEEDGSCEEGPVDLQGVDKV